MSLKPGIAFVFFFQVLMMLLCLHTLDMGIFANTCSHETELGSHGDNQVYTSKFIASPGRLKRVSSRTRSIFHCLLGEIHTSSHGSQDTPAPSQSLFPIRRTRGCCVCVHLRKAHLTWIGSGCSLSLPPKTDTHSNITSPTKLLLPALQALRILFLPA